MAEITMEKIVALAKNRGFVYGKKGQGYKGQRYFLEKLFSGGI